MSQRRQTITAERRDQQRINRQTRLQRKAFDKRAR